MVRVSRSAEAIPLLVPNDALRRDEARAGAGPARGRRGAGEHSGSRNFLVATLLLCVAGAVMYAASSSLAADERADMRARINDARMVSRASFLPETLLSSTSASVNAELRTMTAEAGDLGAFADASAGTRADATPEPAVAFRTKSRARASCSCACCVGSACELEALTASLGARSGFGSGGDADDAASSAETTSHPPSAVVRSFDAGSPAACDAEACRARFAEACPKHASAGIVSARFHAESAPGADGADGASARGGSAFESFETSVVGAVYDETAFEDVYAPPSADDVRRAEEWVRDATMKARAEAEQAAQDAAETALEESPAEAPEEAAAQAPEEAAAEALAAEAPEEAVAEAPEEAAAEAPEEAVAEAPEEAVADAPEEAAEAPGEAAEAPEEAVAEAPEEAVAEAPEEAAAQAPEEASAQAPEEAAAQAPEEASAQAPEEVAAEAPDAPVVAEEDSADAEASPSPSNVSAAARLGWVVDGTSGAFRRDTEAPLGREETEDAERGALVWDALRAVNDAAARGDGDAFHASVDALEEALAVEVLNDATGETERFAPQLNGGVPHYVDVDVSTGGGEVEAFVAPVVTTAATLGGTVPDPDRPDLWAPRAAEDAEEGAAEEGAAEGDSAENAPPVTTRREFVPLHAEHDPSAPWRAPVALVVAHYDEWDDLDEMPVWANNSKDPRYHPDAPLARGYTVAPMYQRRRPESPGYVPNHGYEGGVYLRFVLDHYDNLPDVAVFVQADADKIGDVPSRLGKVVTRQKERGDVGYLPINVGGDRNLEQVYFHKRDPYQEWWSETSLRDVDRCWRTVAGWWGHEWPSATVPTVSGYCCNYFAASREKIRATPLATWRKAYETLIERGECAPGAGPVATRADDKWQIAIALEHMAHVMFGGHFPHYPRHCGEARVGERADEASSENENENENAFLDAPVMGTFPDACCGGDACGAKGIFYAEDTDWTADEPDFESGAPPRLEPPDLGEGEDLSAWAALGHTAQARDDALVGLAALSGMSPYSDADPAVRSVEFKRAALSAAQEDITKLGDDEDAWRVAIEAGASVKGLARAYAAAKAAARAAGASAAE